MPNHRQLAETYLASAVNLSDTASDTAQRHALTAIAYLLLSIDDRLASPRPVVAKVENWRDWPGDDGS